MATVSILRKLHVREISLVDNPANPAAQITIMKRAASGQGEESVQNQAELQAALEKAQADLEKAAKERDELKAKHAEVEKKAADVSSLEKKVADFATRAEDLEKKLALAEDARTAIEFAKRAEDEFPAVPGTAVEKGALLRHLEGAPEAVKAIGLEVLKRANAALAVGMVEKGSSFGGTRRSESATVELAKRAEELMSKDPSISKAAAMEKVLVADPALAERRREEVNRGL